MRLLIVALVVLPSCVLRDDLRERSIERCLREAGADQVSVEVEDDGGWFNYAPNGDVDQHALDRCLEQ
ncbi:MAG: hypothetical protein ACN4GZ_17845 [Acidimicrobiales bacterium]